MKRLKLIAETDLHNGYQGMHDIIVESKEGKDGLCKFNATFIQCEKQNRNGRVYPKDMMTECVSRYVKDRITPGSYRSFGELDHPDGVEINLQKVSHYIESLQWQGDDVIGTAQLMDTTCGRTADAILKSGCKLGVSTRGLGELGMREGYETSGGQVVTEYELICVDIVADPSAPEGWVNGIYESKEYIISGGEYTPFNSNEVERAAKAFNLLENQLKNIPKKDKQEYLFNAAKKFISKL